MAVAFSRRCRITRWRAGVADPADGCSASRPEPPGRRLVAELKRLVLVSRREHGTPQPAGEQ
ncbi:MAG: hypothetical protein AVDCRST_MAG67-2597 [uncultured Solirubrobacteraceae bacterium]|uniref:Uncharacterized protein n=1 Tax=uncultured Solirubrobacteraceae bacterium TaxID=1162706 RepID=A0A6J4SYS0_9ACTN|nr:MAG: hypothetical protein AVDCRST_MAG67-2597 [uncultured Solirubrobacteraceae bacterium]